MCNCLWTEETNRSEKDVRVTIGDKPHCTRNAIKTWEDSMKEPGNLVIYIECCDFVLNRRQCCLLNVKNEHEFVC